MDSALIALFENLKKREWMIATAESCTGGMIAAHLTETPGSSAYMDRGFVTYSNHAKMEMLSVPASLIEDHGAVSPQVAEAMAEGALKASKAGIAVSVTGIAGPGGGTDKKPVGLVYIGVATWDKVQSFEHRFHGDRVGIRQQAMDAAIAHVTRVAG
jgi:nicotinamide-nucleotide amidase